MTKQLEALIAEMKAAAENFSRLRKLMWDQSPEFNYREYAEALAKYSVNAVCIENVLALIAALEQSQQTSVHLREQRDEWERKAISNFEECAEMAARNEELESQRKLAFTASNRWADRSKDAEKRIAELEASHAKAIQAYEYLVSDSKLAVKLPPKEPDSGSDSQVDINAGFANRMREQCVKAIRGAGITVQGGD